MIKQEKKILPVGQARLGGRVKNDRLYIVTALGNDSFGLVAKISKSIVQARGNIVDIEENIIHGLFSIILIIDMANAKLSFSEFRKKIQQMGKKTNLKVLVQKYTSGRRKAEKREILITLLGKDKPGIVSQASSLLAKHYINIEQTHMLARGELFTMEMTTDFSDARSSLEKVRQELSYQMEKMGISIILQKKDIYFRSKKLIVFDMDSTLIDVEIIDSLAKVAGFEKEVQMITSQTSAGKMDYKEALKKRVILLKGLKVEVLKKIAEEAKLTPGAEELLQILKKMGYKIALISGGFTFFTEHLKQKFSLDYAFGNKLKIKDNVLTGMLEEPIIDEIKKAEIIEFLSQTENIPLEEIVAVGDSANDRFMLQKAGLGVAFNPKPILKQFADGIITQKNLFGLIYCLGIPREEIKRVISHPSLF